MWHFPWALKGQTAPMLLYERTLQHNRSNSSYTSNAAAKNA